MKIGLVGAPCTGKTTLAKAVAERLNLTFIGESFEDAEKQCENRPECPVHISKGDESWPEYFDKVWHDTDSYQLEIVNFTKGIAWNLEAKEKAAGDNFITDSASPSQAAAGLIYNTFLEDTSQLMEWYNYQIERAKNYTHLFFLPYVHSLQMVDDNRRPTNKALQKQFDMILPSILVCDFDVPDMTGIAVWPVTLERRIEFILSEVGAR